jgi:serine/threonine protein kinase
VREAFSIACARPIGASKRPLSGSARRAFRRIERDEIADLLPEPPVVEDDFRGTARFTVRRRLGVGGMGVVYEVDDTVRHEVVALKTLRHATAADVYRLKREFRSLADVVHPNLVCLYELFADDHSCFFTMELVPGCNFVDYVRGEGDRWRSDERLVSAFAQLVDGVSALHRLGKLHRDIKPSNVLVTPEARVVILDFGLITELAPHAFHDRGPRRHADYMAPRPDRAGPTEAADWYASASRVRGTHRAFPFAGESPKLPEGSSTRPRRRTCAATCRAT